MENEVQALEVLREPMALGEVFFQSGMFVDIKSQSQAVVKILAGKELGLSPMESMNNLYMVNNHIALTAKIIASKIKRSGKYDYKVNKLDDTECSLTFFEILKDGTKEKLGDSVFTFKDAAKAGLVNKDNWKNYPKNMLYARALSNGNRWFCPDVTTGFYSTEEMEDLQPGAKESVVTIDTNGEVKTDA